MATSRLYKRGSTWWCWFYDAQGKQVRKSTKSSNKNEASRTLRDLERRANSPSRAKSPNQGGTAKKVLYEIDGQTRTLPAWARESGIPESTLRARIVVQGLDMDLALEIGRQRAKGYGRLKPPIPPGFTGDVNSPEYRAHVRAQREAVDRRHAEEDARKAAKQAARDSVTKAANEARNVADREARAAGASAGQARKAGNEARKAVLAAGRKRLRTRAP
jgi:hypothetical protein